MHLSTLPRHRLGASPPHFYAAAVSLIGFIFLLVPRLTGQVALHLHKEDGTIFLSDFLARGWMAMLEPYSGYLHVMARLVVGIVVMALPLQLASWGIAVSMALIRMGFMWLAWPFFTKLTQSWRWGLACASVFIFIPAGQHEVLGNVTNLRWFCDAILVIILLTSYRRKAVTITAAVVAALCVMTDPLGLIVAPLAIWQLVRACGWWERVPSLTYGVGAAIQFFSMNASERAIDSDGALQNNLLEALVQVLVRGLDVTAFGVTGSQILIRISGVAGACVVAMVPLALLIIAVTRRSGNAQKARPAIVTLCVAGGALLMGTLFFADMQAIAITDWWTPAEPSRYSVPFALLVTPALILAAWALGNRLVTYLLAAVLLMGIAADFRGDPWNTAGPVWSDSVSEARLACADGANGDPVVVQITPEGVAMSWTATIPCAAVR
ncbi:hypothetical protein [Tessaracoccus palaemonis]|uniref:DUF2029 domain-containing protein n=1 Tax=Tessaracoccus palaemonis TaxID=2829499 RepID=A0ABX8SL42_9ACTN|nr:hypothetical protein [Tessaracoccus palaemonis]QXT64087.1 hypothetical protein KDB89_06445 [Tessaracoccus palaemonis]